MTRLRDLLLWAALWAVYLLLVQPLITSAQGVAIAWIGGGIAAGLLIILEVRRWWPLLLVTAGALAVGYRSEIEGWVLALQVAVDIVSIVVFARVVRSHRRDLSGLGADVPWVAFAAIGASAIRLLPALVIALASSGTRRLQRRRSDGAGAEHRRRPHRRAARPCWAWGAGRGERSGCARTARCCSAARCSWPSSS